MHNLDMLAITRFFISSLSPGPCFSESFIRAPLSPDNSILM